VTVRLRGKFAFQIAGIENRLAGLMQAGFAGINHEIYRTLVSNYIEDYSSLAPESLTTLLQRASSRLTWARNCSGVSPMGTEPISNIRS